MWASTYRTNYNLHRLSILRDKVMRMICHVKPRESADHLYTKLDIMKFIDINPFLIDCFARRYCYG